MPRLLGLVIQRFYVSLLSFAVLKDAQGIPAFLGTVALAATSRAMANAAVAQRNTDFVECAFFDIVFVYDNSARHGMLSAIYGYFAADIRRQRR